MNKFEKLKKLYPHEGKKIDNWENQEKRAIIYLDVKEHQAIKWIENDLIDSIYTINEKLLSDDPLTDIERECLLTDRQRCEWFLNIFTKSDETIKKIKDNLQKAYDKKRVA